MNNNQVHLTENGRLNWPGRGSSKNDTRLPQLMEAGLTGPGLTRVAPSLTPVSGRWLRQAGGSVTDLSQPLEVVTALERKQRRGNVTNVIWVRTVDAVTNSLFLLLSFSIELFNPISHHFLPPRKLLLTLPSWIYRVSGIVGLKFSSFSLTKTKHFSFWFVCRDHWLWRWLE